MADGRKCKVCGIVKPLGDFYVRHVGDWTGPDSKCKACRIADTVECHRRNPIPVRAAVRRWAKKNHKQTLVQKARYRSRHAEALSRKATEYGKKHPEKMKQYRRTSEGRRRAAKRGGISDPVPAWFVNRLFDLFEGMCAYCKTARASHIDHVNPLSKGGSHTVENLLPSCPTCNFKKHNKTPDVWAAESGVDLTGLLGKVRSLGGENNKGDLPN